MINIDFARVTENNDGLFLRPGKLSFIFVKVSGRRRVAARKAAQLQVLTKASNETTARIGKSINDSIYLRIHEGYVVMYQFPIVHIYQSGKRGLNVSTNRTKYVQSGSDFLLARCVQIFLKRFIEIGYERSLLTFVLYLDLELPAINGEIEGVTFQSHNEVLTI